MKWFFSCLIFLSYFSVFGQSTPIYLKANSPAPTGHVSLDKLKKRAIAYDEYEWLWVRTPSGHNGWILKDSALLPLDFSRQAILPKGEPINPEPKTYQLPQRTLSQAQIVSLIDRRRDWYKILYKIDDKKYYGWVRSRYLSPYSRDAGYFFSTVETQLRQKPQMKSKILRKIEPGLPIIPLNAKASWALVQFDGKKGYIPLRNFKSRLDVAIKVKTSNGYFKPHPQLYEKKISEIFSNPLWVGTGAFTIDLKQKPDMGSKTVEKIPPWQSLSLQGYSIKKWGKSFVPRVGEVWWPETTIESNVEVIEKLSPTLAHLKASEIYQIEKSPVVPGLRFASAPHGIFRSFDGKSWHPLKDFHFGYPIKVTQTGVLFVADKVSFDHGESFQHFVRWDLVFDSLPGGRSKSSGPIQIINVEPNLKNHKQVTLSLKVGHNKYLQIFTPDFGQTWRVQ